jgi:hypothetical protein
MSQIFFTFVCLVTVVVVIIIIIIIIDFACLHHGLLQQYLMPPSQLQFPKLVPPPNFTQNKGRKFQVTTQLHLTAQHSFFVCTESRLCVNCSMVRNWKVCQPEHKRARPLQSYPLAPQPFQFSSVPNSSAHVGICTILNLLEL